MKIKTFFICLLISAVAIASFACNQSETSEVQSIKQADNGEVKTIEKLGADGFDLISYFEIDTAIKGSPEFSLVYEGVRWYFSSKKNQDAFKSNSEKYLPKFGEHCPYSLADGKEIKGKPTYHKVIDGKLYFFYNKEYADKFEKDSKLLLERARDKWEKMDKKTK